MTFRIDGDAKGASIQVDGLAPAQVANGLRQVLMQVYAHQGVAMSKDDMTLVNLAFAEAQLAIDAAERAARRARRGLYVLWLCSALNVAAGLWNVFAAVHS
jgi:hypothetical protein